MAQTRCWRWGDTRAPVEGREVSRDMQPLLTMAGPAAEQTTHGASSQIYVIHQDLRLVPQLNTVENLDLGRRYGARAAMPTHRRAEIMHARELLAQWDAAVGVDSGRPLTSGEKLGLPPIQILTKSDITVNPMNGWVAYPDFAQRFAKLWGAAR